MPPHLPGVLRFPTCNRLPKIGRCEPWPKDAGPQPWYAVCYSLGPYEHAVGVNGDSHHDVMEKWNAEVTR